MDKKKTTLNRNILFLFIADYISDYNKTKNTFKHSLIQNGRTVIQHPYNMVNIRRRIVFSKNHNTGPFNEYDLTTKSL